MLTNVIILVVLAVVVVVYAIERNVRGIVRQLEERRADLQERAWNARRDYECLVRFARLIEAELQASPDERNGAIADRVRRTLAAEEAETWQLELVTPEVVGRARSLSSPAGEPGDERDEREGLVARVSHGLDDLAHRARQQPEWLEVYGARGAAAEAGFLQRPDDAMR